ncbi:MAG: GNAT family N-acetyltransferase, partial [Candidatus Magasanikbacteria bacterium]|nr:GNAT family N-acetyltransferase [Candidatus Magasanikbacteria bacterium]
MARGRRCRGLIIGFIRRNLVSEKPYLCMKNLLKIPKPIIFEALPKDISGIMAVQKATWLATYVNAEYDITVRDIKVINFVSAERHKRWEGTLQKKKILRVWVAKNKVNKIVGFCVARKAKLSNILGAIYVLPRYQGKGIGQKLADVAFEWLGEKKSIIVDVVKYNATAI